MCYVLAGDEKERGRKNDGYKTFRVGRKKGRNQTFKESETPKYA